MLRSVGKQSGESVESVAVVNGSPHIRGGTNRCTPSVLLSWFVTEKLNIESSASCLGRRTARSAVAAQGAGKQIT